MLDRTVIKEYLTREFAEYELKIPDDISENALVEIFCLYTEDDYYEWIKDNFKSFFNYGDPDWDSIRVMLS